VRPLIPTFIQNQYQNKAFQGSFLATSLFVDISGFTPLTEKLMQQGAEGAEILSQILDDIFQPMVARVYAQGGIIPHFAGDAFTAVFEGTPTGKVFSLATRFIRTFDKYPVFSTPFGDFVIQVRIGLSYGLVDWGIVGQNQKSFYFKGSAIERATLAQKQAAPQEIIADNWFTTASKTYPSKELSLEKNVPHPLSIFKSEDDTDEIFPEDLNAEYADVDKDILLSFLPQNIISFNEKGEFRDVVSVFISFQNLTQYDDIQLVTSIILEQFEKFGGFFKEIDCSEKNLVMVGFFGAPVAYENNATRALECVLSIKEELATVQAMKNFSFKSGLASGVAFAGMIGGRERCQYAVVGNRVNLAARLMQNANWGEILVTKALTSRQFDFYDKGNLHYKGIKEAMPTYCLLKKNAEEILVFTGEMIGREPELIELTKTAQTILSSKVNGIINVFGEAGVGKSRFVFEAKKRLNEGQVITWATCSSDQILRKSFNPFVYFLRHYFKQNPEKTIQANKEIFENDIKNLLRHLPERANTEGVELERTQTVLAALMGLNYPDSLWEQLDAKGRYDNTFTALSNFLLALSYVQPLVVELEDAHWIDDDSKAFLRSFVPKTVGKPILFIATSRYSDEGFTEPFLDENFLNKHHIMPFDLHLSVFSKEDLKYFTEQKLKGKAHPELLETLWKTANGNPFYAEQIIDYLKENNDIQFIDNQYINPNSEWSLKNKDVKITTSIASVLTARIDRFSTILKETVKAAAVIGREFELPVLAEVMLAHEEYVQRNGNSQIVLREQISTAEKGQIWHAMTELRYIFRHTLLREAIYDMQLKTKLRELHAMIAQAIEKVYIESLDERLIDLAFHYEQADNKTKAGDFLKKAGDFARRNFQNQQALDLYERLLKVTQSSTEKIKTLIRAGEILQLIGRWDDSFEKFEEALTLSETSEGLILRGRAHNALGTLQMLKGSYNEAHTHFEKAVLQFEQLVDYQGITQSYGKLGNLFFRQGDYEKAKNYFTQSIQISRSNNFVINPQIVSNLGLTYMNQGDYTEGVACQEEELELCEQRKDLIGMASLSVNLGIVRIEKGDDEAALFDLEKGLILAQKLNNKQLISIALGCIGGIYYRKGDFETAQDFLEQDLSITNELGDKQGIAIASELMGRLYSTSGDFAQARLYFETSIALSRQLSYQKGIAKGLHGLGELYLYQTDFLKSLQCFDEAISISQNIDNQLIMAYCMADKALVLMKVGDWEGVKALKVAVENVSEKFKNKNLSFHIRTVFNKV
jgi:tetratricopeptide (TPR) repeat protein/class 3 adenylate cyclase